jgi:hypothetical protein
MTPVQFLKRTTIIQQYPRPNRGRFGQNSRTYVAR